MYKQNPSFSAFNWKTGLLYDYSENEYPTKLHAIDNGREYFNVKTSTFYGYVFKGDTKIVTSQGKFKLITGMYFSVSMPFAIRGGQVLIIERMSYLGYFHIGGVIENQGRLKYIDGCTDSLLIPPPRKGDPCLNLLHFPDNITQTPHTHPSMRVGVVAKGNGECVTPWGNISLFPGQIFIIHQEGEKFDTFHPCDGVKTGEAIIGTHSFNTDGNSMDVIAWHPDTDFGPADEDHPMINRTIVDGVSAKGIDAIRTK